MTGLLDEQRRYYSERAAEFDDAYERVGQHDRGESVNAAWRADMARVASVFDAVPFGGDVIELAAGTGYWTQRLTDRAGSLTVIDGSAEMLTINRPRLGSAPVKTDYEVVDLFAWRPTRTWDACVFCFWLCHVRDDRIRPFLQAVHGALRQGGVVCFVDKAATSEPGAERVVRTLNDGREFAIIDHARPAQRLVDEFAHARLPVTVETIGGRFCIGWGTRP